MQRASALATVTMTLRTRTGRRGGTPTGPPSTKLPVQLTAACAIVAQGEGEDELDGEEGEGELEDDEAVSEEDESHQGASGDAADIESDEDTEPGSESEGEP